MKHEIVTKCKQTEYFAIFNSALAECSTETCEI